MRNWVIDASPLILMANIHQVRLLSELPDALIIPAPVAEEIQAGPEDDPARKWLLRSGSSYVHPVTSVAPEVDDWDLGQGERAVLSWAYRDKACTAVVDDLAARRCAKALGISFTGTVGVILVARHENKISAVGPLLDELVKAGLRISKDVITRARRLAGEL